jgi:hypothetical protein
MPSTSDQIAHIVTFPSLDTFICTLSSKRCALSYRGEARARSLSKPKRVAIAKKELRLAGDVNVPVDVHLKRRSLEHTRKLLPEFRH